MKLSVEGPTEDITEFRKQLNEFNQDSTFEVGAVKEKEPDLFRSPSLRYSVLLEFFIAFSAQVSAGAAEEVARKILEKAKHFPKIRIKLVVEQPKQKEIEDESTGSPEQ
ncbi:MAG TPA: hypothetical protein VNV62_05125 [Trebonia sp.]|jgi:hypothetical protein|nr:hypothetical protein [Trebonia sp.]